jgi:hypothetical protein
MSLVNTNNPSDCQSQKQEGPGAGSVAQVAEYSRPEFEPNDLQKHKEGRKEGSFDYCCIFHSLSKAMRPGTGQETRQASNQGRHDVPLLNAGKSLEIKLLSGSQMLLMDWCWSVTILSWFRKKTDVFFVN